MKQNNIKEEIINIVSPKPIYTGRRIGNTLEAIRWETKTTEQIVEELTTLIDKVREEAIRELTPLFKAAVTLDEIHIFKDPNHEVEMKQQSIYVSGYNRAVCDMRDRLDEYLKFIEEKNKWSTK